MKKFTKIILSAILIIMVMLQCITVASAAEREKGDMDGNGSINLADIVGLRGAIMRGNPTFAEMTYGNMNYDGELNLLDIILLRAKIMRTGKSAPVLEPEAESRLVEDFYLYVKENIRPATELDEISLRNYYGTYSDCIVAFLNAPIGYDDRVRVVNIAGYVFQFGSEEPLWVYNGTTFLPIENAYYDAGWLTAEDIEAVWKSFYVWWPK